MTDNTSLAGSTHGEQGNSASDSRGDGGGDGGGDDPSVGLHTVSDTNSTGITNITNIASIANDTGRAGGPGGPGGGADSAHPASELANGGVSAPVKSFWDEHWSSDGRMGRVTYLLYGLALWVLHFTTLLLAAGFASLFGSQVFALIPLLLLIPLIWFGACATAKRFHDVGRSGWWMLTLFIPLINIVVSLYLIFAPGQKSANAWGLPPRVSKDSKDSKESKE